MWLRSAAFDGAFFLLPGLLSLALVAFDLVPEDWQAPLAFFFLGIFGSCHVHATLTLTHWDGVLLKRDPLRMVLAPLLLAAATMLVFLFVPNGRSILLTAFVVWGLEHQAKQHVGFLMLYRARAREKEGRTWDKVTLRLALLGPVVALLVAGGPYHLGSTRIWTLDLPDPWGKAFAAASLAIGGGAALLWLVRAPFAPKTALYVMAVASYWIGLLVPSSVLAKYLVVNVYHAAQYVALVWLYHAGRRARSAQVPWVTRLSAPVLLPLFFGLLLATTGFEHAITQALAPPGLIFFHYWIDGHVWRGAYNPELALNLGFGPPRPVAA